jgi:hypothetical protein
MGTCLTLRSGAFVGIFIITWTCVAIFHRSWSVHHGRGDSILAYKAQQEFGLFITSITINFLCIALITGGNNLSMLSQKCSYRL